MKLLKEHFDLVLDIRIKPIVCTKTVSNMYIVFVHDYLVIFAYQTLFYEQTSYKSKKNNEQNAQTYHRHEDETSNFCLRWTHLHFATYTNDNRM